MMTPSAQDSNLLGQEGYWLEYLREQQLMPLWSWLNCQKMRGNKLWSSYPIRENATCLLYFMLLKNIRYNKTK